MLLLDNKQYLSVHVNDIEIPMMPSDFESIIINQHALAHVPSLRILNYRDKKGFFTEGKSLNDATKITVMMGKTQNEAEQRAVSFRLADPPVQKEGNSSNIFTMYGVFDNMKYLREQAGSAYTGTSSTVVSTLADECSLHKDIDPTNDSMPWLSGRMSYAKFLRHLSNHGYINNLSAMVNCVSTKDGGTLMYKNLSSLVDSSHKPLPRFYHSVEVEELSIENQFRILKSKVSSTAGYANSMFGYSNRRSTPELDGTITERTTVDAIRTLSNNFEINKDVKAALGDVHNTYSSPDCGNAHSEFETAVYQNRRLRSLYNSVLKVMVEKSTNVDLLDVVEVEVYDMVTRANMGARSANYVVTAKSQEIKGTRYRESFLLTSTGKNSEADPDNKLELT